MLTISVCALLSGADDFEDISQSARIKRAVVASLSEPGYGIASLDTVERIFAALDPRGVERALREWVLRVIPALRPEQVTAIAREICECGADYML